MSLQPKLDAFKAGAPFVEPRLVVNLSRSRFVVLATALETNGTYTAFEISVPPGAGTPLHAHSEQEAVFYVVRGYLRFQVGEGTVMIPCSQYKRRYSGAARSMSSTNRFAGPADC